MSINGNFQWTGLVIVTGWAPTVQTAVGSNTEIVGSFFGEDSVMSSGETSLDSATIIMKIDGPFKVCYSANIFRYGGFLYNYLPYVKKDIVGVKDLNPAGKSTSSEETEQDIETD